MSLGDTPSAEDNIAQPQKEAAGFSLDSVLNGDHDNLGLPNVQDASEDEDAHTGHIVDGFCVECEGT